MKHFFAAVFVMVTVACASGPNHTVTSSPGHRDTLFGAEIETNRVAGWTAYDLISRLRPEFLRSRGVDSFRQSVPATPVVYINETRYGDLTELRNFDASVVKQVQYLTASAATTRFGMDHTAGAILVFTK